MEVDGIHQQVRPDIVKLLSKQSDEELHKLKELVDKKIDSQTGSIQYWRAVRYEIGKQIQKSNARKEEISSRSLDPFTIAINKPLRPLQKIIEPSQFTIIKDDHEKTLVPKIHCRANYVKPETRYACITGKTFETIEGYIFDIYYENYKGKVQYKLNEIKGDDDNLILMIYTSDRYSDISLKIPNIQIEYSHRKGYECYFDRGLFHLSFTFKKTYRTVNH